MTYFNAMRLKTNRRFSSELINDAEGVVAYRVPEDAEYAVFMMNNETSCRITIKAGDTVFGGKDLVIDCEEGYYGIYLDLNTFIQRSGEQKNCVVIENDGDSFMSELAVLGK